MGTRVNPVPSKGGRLFDNSVFAVFSVWGRLPACGRAAAACEVGSGGVQYFSFFLLENNLRLGKRRIK
jgi:hypothetical protein